MSAPPSKSFATRRRGTRTAPIPCSAARRSVKRSSVRRRVCQFGGLAVHAEEAPGRALVGARHRNRRHSCNVFERLWFAMRGDQFGTSDEDHLVGPERAHGEIGILQRWLANPQSDVEAFVDDVDAAIGGVERDAHSRLVAEEAHEYVGDAALQQTGGTGDAHEALWRGKNLAHGAFPRLPFFEEAQPMGWEFFS